MFGGLEFKEEIKKGPDDKEVKVLVGRDTAKAAEARKAQIELLSEMMPRAKAIFAKAVQEVKDGKHASRAQAITAVESALGELEKELKKPKELPK